MVWTFILYLLYGLAFFTLGVAILSRDTRLSELGIARIIWLLAAFGIIHGIHEWLELLSQLNPTIQTLVFFRFRLIVVSTSFLFLLYFGIFINIITFGGDTALKTTSGIIKIIVGISALTLILYAAYLDLASNNDENTRLLVAFPGGLLAGIGLVMYSRTVRTFSKNVSINFILAGIFMICYSFLTGLIPSHVTVPYVNIEIVLFRGISAFFILFFTIRALSVFSIEQHKLIDERLLRFSQTEKLTSMGILAAGIAHEINNPLTNVSLNLEMLKDLIGSDERARKRIEAIERNTDRASRIAGELLHFSREKETALQPTDINEVVKNTMALLKNRELYHIIDLQLRNTPRIKAIPWKLEEVFINLLLNSFDACTDTDRIEIRTFFSDKTVNITISDTGHGISAENFSKVFDPFFTTKEVGKGTGLGLSVCYNIIKQHGGEISLSSKVPEGTTVTISFPVQEDEQ